MCLRGIEEVIDVYEMLLQRESNLMQATVDRRSVVVSHVRLSYVVPILRFDQPFEATPRSV